MVQTEKVIFISCGQYTDEEKQLGLDVAKLVDEHTPFKAYFAQNQSTVEGMTENILDALSRSVGLIAIMHERGVVRTPAGEIVRGSVWIEQEIAVAAFLQQILKRSLFVRAYVRKGIAREGMRDKLLINAIEFLQNQEILNDLQKAVPEWGSVLTRLEAEKSIDAVEVVPTIVEGKAPFFAIRVEHDFSQPIGVCEIRLQSDGYELMEPARRQQDADWTVPPNFPFRLNWTPEKNPAESLIRLNPNAGLKFEVPLEVTLVCDVLGRRKKFTRKLWVKVIRSKPEIIQLV